MFMPKPIETSAKEKPKNLTLIKMKSKKLPNIPINCWENIWAMF